MVLDFGFRIEGHVLGLRFGGQVANRAAGGMGVCSGVGFRVEYGRLSTLCSLLAKYSGPYLIGDLEKEHEFDKALPEISSD